MSICLSAEASCCCVGFSPPPPDPLSDPPQPAASSTRADARTAPRAVLRSRTFTTRRLLTGVLGWCTFLPPGSDDLQRLRVVARGRVVVLQAIQRRLLLQAPPAPPLVEDG